MALTLQELLRISAKKQQNKIAVRCDGQEITYQELDALSDRISYLLTDYMNGQNSRIGILLDKSIEAVGAIFGVLKSGAAYVPLDPSGPTERLRHIINDCGIRQIVVSSEKLSLAEEITEKEHTLNHLCIIDENLNITMKTPDNRNPNDRIKLSSRPETDGSDRHDANLAYLMYTSGSTGHPKGVMISHAASLAFINWAYETFRIRATDRVSSHAPFHFDLSIFDIFVTIKAGATICLISKGVSLFPRSLAEFIEKERITTWYSVPSVLVQLTLHGNLQTRDLSALKRILFAGEQFPVKYLKHLIEIMPDVEYANLYGPTETNVCASYSVQNEKELPKILPIGKASSGASIYLLDEQERPVAKGKTGELCVSGPTLMDGYWNSKKNSNKAVVQTLAGEPEPIYKTGDFARKDREGNYIFLGRRDNMIKSRGYRVEPNEIETVLLEHPAIEEAALVAIPDEIMGNTLKAFIVPNKEQSVSVADIKLFCAQKLPNYMIPEIRYREKALPKTSNGKVDRLKLGFEFTAKVAKKK